MNSVINSANTQEAYSICNLIILEINTQFFLSFSTKSIKAEKHFTVRRPIFSFFVFKLNLVEAFEYSI